MNTTTTSPPATEERSTHPLIEQLRAQNPDRIDVRLDGIPILTILDGETVFEATIDLNQPHFLMTVHIDENPDPVYFQHIATPTLA
ncbi:MAG: hypothetical protein HC795_06555 [Coleofasciculaceae cyanobacterium RL_1_1]|nr:hypothetical protein [Coleofasciculaceae cyanobacterium RL_1_1]